MGFFERVLFHDGAAAESAKQALGCAGLRARCRLLATASVGTNASERQLRGLVGEAAYKIRQPTSPSPDRVAVW